LKKFMRAFVVSCLVVAVALPTVASAHSGRTDSRGGHNCSENSKRKGLCTGYHYHNGGGSSSNASNSSKSSNSTKASNSSKSSNSSKASNDSKASSSPKTSNSSKAVNTNSPKTSNGVPYEKLQLKLQSKDGAIVNLEKQMIAVQGNTYIYAKDFANAFGFSLTADKSKNISLTKDHVSIKIHAATNKIDLNGKYSGFNAVKAGGFTYLPLRFAVQAAGMTITSVDNSTVHIKSAQ